MAVVFGNGTTKNVKNLGWLRRHFGLVERLSLDGTVDGGAYLAAWLSDGRCYACHFADYSIARAWVHRHSLRGLALTVTDAQGQVHTTTC